MRNRLAHALSTEPPQTRSAERVLREVFWRPSRKDAPAVVVSLAGARKDKPRSPRG